MINVDELQAIAEAMAAQQIEFDPGLSDEEISAVEQICGFRFPADLRIFLQIGVPRRWRRYDWVDDRFPNWREDPLAIMHDVTAQNRQMFHFDIENNGFWVEEEWGARPDRRSKAFAICDQSLQTVPPLIPIYVHRFLPAEPNLPGNPVLSVWQPLDTLYYGYNLSNYLLREFIPGYAEDRGQLSDYRPIRFWSKIANGVA